MALSFSGHGSALTAHPPLAAQVRPTVRASGIGLRSPQEPTEKHRTKLRSTNPLERLNKEIARRSDVVGIYPNDASLIRLAGALLLEENDEWLVGRRYLSLESMAFVLAAEHAHAKTLEVATLPAA